jgi:hypothetical protein
VAVAAGRKIRQQLDTKFYPEKLHQPVTLLLKFTYLQTEHDNDDFCKIVADSVIGLPYVRSVMQIIMARVAACSWQSMTSVIRASDTSSHMHLFWSHHLSMKSTCRICTSPLAILIELS